MVTWIKGIHKGLLHTAHQDVSDEELEAHNVDWRTEGAVSDVKDQGMIRLRYIT